MMSTPYVRGYILDDLPTPHPEREQVIRAYAAKHLPEIPFHGCFIDPAQSRSTPLFHREAGHALLVQWRRDDHLIFDSSLAFASGRDLCGSVGCMQGVGIVAHFLDLGVVSTDVRAMELLIKSQSLPAERRSITSKRTHQRSREAGSRTNQHAMPGYRWVRSGDGFAQEINPEEWPDIETIASLRREGLSWKEISNAMTQAEYERLGKPLKLMSPRTWSEWRCRQAVKVHAEREQSLAGAT